MRSAQHKIRVERDDNGNYHKNLEKSIYQLPAIKRVSFRFVSIRYLGPMIWQLVLDELLDLKS